LIKIKGVKYERLSPTTEEQTYQVVCSHQLDSKQIKALRDARLLGCGQHYAVGAPTTKTVGKRTYYVYAVVDHSDSSD
jgi:hypothetical protein